jgi:hypothetical protein
MSAATYVVLSILPLLLALGAYLWYVTPSPEDLAAEVLRHRKPTKPSGRRYATKPQPNFNMTHINCLS